MYTFDEVFHCIHFCKFQFENVPVEKKKKTNKTQNLSTLNESDGNQSARNQMLCLTKAKKAFLLQRL